MPKDNSRVSIHVFIDAYVDKAIRGMSTHHGDYAFIVREVLKAFVDNKHTGELKIFKDEIKK